MSPAGKVPAPDRTLRGYELAERIGEGSFGVVYRARQTAVGREVALKAIRPELADQPEFVRRFELEAQLVARLEHAHIVPLYDYWREPGGAYLAMRLLKGGSAGDALERDGPVTLEHAARLLEQVGAALASAHRHGVIHRDLKPANVLLDEDGNAYLSDFGIAKDLAAPKLTATGAAPGSLAYTAPEQLSGAPLGPYVDLYGLGLVLWELLAGRHPFEGSTLEALLAKQLSEPLPPLGALRPDLPPTVEGVLQRATAKDPTQRYPDVLAMLAAFRQAAGMLPAPTVAAPEVELRNPYKGLRAFLEADALDFFGRDALVERLVERLRESRFLAVVGPSGSGKSSLVRAGLIPSLIRSAPAESSRWVTVEMLPGPHPLEELEAALLRVAINPPPSLIEQLERDELGLLRALKRVLPGDDTELVLVIDQFEEVFTLVDDEERRARFLAGLAGAVAEPRSRLRVVVTLRADFYDRPLRYPGLAELMSTHTETVVPLTPDELERSVSGPAERVGVTPEPGLVAQIVADLADQPGGLPLLQYALTDLFERRSDRTLTLAAYRDLGGVLGALARRADDLYEGLDPEGREVARQLFLRLVTLGEGTADTRRRVPRSELTGLAGASPHADEILDRFGAARLLSFDRDPQTRAPTVEVAHEALLREWGRLRGWVDDAREDLRQHRRLVQAASDWVESGRDPSLLLRGSRLAQLEAWATDTALVLTDIERGYVDASVVARRREEAEEETRRVREAALERRSLRRLRVLVAVLAVAALVATGLTLFAFDQRGEARREAGRADQEALVATARELAAAAVANLDVDPERSILLALQAVDTTRSVDGTVLAEAEEALHRAVGASRVLLTVPEAGLAVEFSPDGSRFVAEPDPGETPAIWDAVSGERLLTLEGHTDDINDVDWSPDGTTVVTASDDGTVRLWNAETGRALETFDVGVATRGPSFSPDGRLVGATGDDGSARAWDLETGRVVLELRNLPSVPEQGLTPQEIVFSPDGTRAAVALTADAEARVFDVGSGELLFGLVGHGEGVPDVDFSPDGTRLATASGDRTARVWDAATGEELFSLFGHDSGVVDVDFSPDGSRLATASWDSTGKVWELTQTGGREVLTLAGHDTSVFGVAFSPDGNRLATGDLGQTVKLWDVSPRGGGEWLTLPTGGIMIGDVEFSLDGRRLVTTGSAAEVQVWDAATGEELLTLETTAPDPPAGFLWLASMDLGPDGRFLASARSDTRAAQGWDAVTGDHLREYGEHLGTVANVAVHPEGALLASSGDDGVRIFEVTTGREVRRLVNHEGAVWGLAFNPEGTLLATSSVDATARIWDVRTWETVHVLQGESAGTRQPLPINSVAFSPNGTRLFTAATEGTATIWDVTTGRKVLEVRAHSAAVSSAVFSPDGRRLATSGEEGSIRLWDAATGERLLTLREHRNLVARLAFSPDGSRLASISPDGTTRVWALDIEDLIQIARDRVTRGLTDEECWSYLHVKRCPTG